MEKMTIAEAVESYKKHGCEYYGPAMQQALLSFSEKKSNEPLNNDSYVDALFLTDIMLQRTMRSMEVLTGNCVDDFLDVLKKPFMEALGRIKNINKGRARFVLLDSDEVPPTLLELQQGGYPIDIRMARTVADAEVSHFIVCDGKMLRDEEYHGPLTPDSLAEVIKAKVYMNSPVHAEAVLSSFESIWNVLDSDSETSPV